MNTEQTSKNIFTYNYNLPLIISLDFLSYSTLFMSTTVCSSACRRYEPLIVAVNLSYFAVFSYYIYWLIYTGCHLHILVRFYRSLLLFYVFCTFPLQGLQWFILPLHAHLIVIFSEVLQQHFRRFLQQFFNTSCCRFSVFQQFQYYLLYIGIIPTWYISTSGSYITCTYTDNLYCSLIYFSNFLMV